MLRFSLDLWEEALEKGVILFLLPPNCTAFLQPIDVGVYGPFKTALYDAINNLLFPASAPREGQPAADGKEAAGDNGREEGSAAIKLKEMLACIFLACNRSLTPHNIRKGFQQTGLWTDDNKISADAIPESVLLHHQVRGFREPAPAAAGREAVRQAPQYIIPDDLKEILWVPTPASVQRAKRLGRVKPTTARAVTKELLAEEEKRQEEAAERKRAAAGRGRGKRKAAPKRKRARAQPIVSSEGEASEPEDSTGSSSDSSASASASTSDDDTGDSSSGSDSSEAEEEPCYYEPASKDDFVAVVLSPDDAKAVGSPYGIGKVLSRPRDEHLWVEWYEQKQPAAGRKRKRNAGTCFVPALRKGKPWTSKVHRGTVLAILGGSLDDNGDFALVADDYEAIQDSLAGYRKRAAQR